jgi:Copper binding periplasmic protein CusF
MAIPRSQEWHSWVLLVAMQRLVALLVFCLVLVPLRAASPLLTLENEQFPSPAGVGANNPHFVVTADKAVSLAWIEPDADHTPAGRSARYDPRARAWARPEPGSASVTPTPKQDEPITVSNAGRMAKAWFEADKKDPRVLVSTSPNAGEQFLMPVRVEDTRPTGTPDLVLLADGTVFVSWPEHYNQNETALWLRRISPGGSLSVPVLLAVLPTGQPKPKLALVKDYDATPAQLLIAYSLGEGETSQIVTRLLTIAPPAAAANPCHACPDPDEATRGHALRGRVVTFSAAHSTLTINHGEIPEVIPGGNTEFKVDPLTLKQAAAGNEVFARIEKRGTEWWLFAARLIVHPETSSTPRP